MVFKEVPVPDRNPKRGELSFDVFYFHIFVCQDEPDKNEEWPLARQGMAWGQVDPFVTGADVTEDLLDTIFREFCVGK